MPSSRIEVLELQNFRGVRRRVPLQLAGKSLLLFGENGTGKSSFIDGLEFVLTGRISSLDGRGQGISSGRHSGHVLEKTPPQATVVLTTGERLGTSSSSPALASPAAAFAKAAGLSEHYVLRRNKVLRFVEAVPKDRYELLRPFLPLDNITELEARFAAAVQRLQAAVEKAEADERKAQDRIYQLAGLQIARESEFRPSLLTAVQRALVTLGLPSIADVSELPTALIEVEHAVEKTEQDLANLPKPLAAPPDLSALKALGNIVGTLDPKVLLDAVEYEHSKADRVVDQGSAAIRTALSDIGSWIARNSATTCPVCEQTIEPDRIAARIALKVESVRDFLEAQASRRSRTQGLEAAVNSARNVVVRALARPEGVADDWWHPRETALRQAQTALDRILVNLRSGDTEQFARFSTEVPALERSLSTVAEQAAVPPYPCGVDQSSNVRKRLSALIELRASLGQLGPLLAPLDSLRQGCVAASARVKTAVAAVSCLEEARKEAVNSIFLDLSTDICDLYERIHPKEPFGDIKIDVKDLGKGGANLRARFCDKTQEDPRGYYSEAHLDTLGICIFLALRKRLRKANPEFDLLVLDDVLTSVDAPHASRIADILLTDFKDYQLIITTHNRIWHEHLRGLIAGKGLDQTFLARTIHQWTLQDGPDVREITEERDDLAKAVQDNKLPEIAGGAGRLLEQILSEMRYELGLAVQAKRDERYTLMDIWPSFKKKVKKEFTALSSACASELDEIDRLWFTRNWVGAHYNEWAKELSIQDAKDLANAVLGLFDKIRCKKCRRFVTRSSTPVGQVACNCGQITHFHPAG